MDGPVKAPFPFRRTVSRFGWYTLFFFFFFLKSHPKMISVLAQERLLGAALGAVFMGAIVFEQRKSIYALISENQPQNNARYELIQPVIAKKPPADFVHVWNKAVDRTLGPVIVALSSRGW